MPRTKQHPSAVDPDDVSCLRLIEALADGNPIPDTSAICPDRLQLIALLAEISKGEQSEFFQNTRQVAERQGLSVHEIASRAAFLLACLDTPGADDPYTILGVEPTATPEAIREAWLSRLTLYHPDRHPDNADWFTRQAARLNEAYHTLKDPARRYAYDERRRRELAARQSRDPFVIPPVLSAPPPIPFLFSRLARHRTPTLITAASVAAVGLVLVALSGRPPEEPQLYLKTVQPVAAVTFPVPTPINSPPPERLIRGEPPALDASVTPHVDRQPKKRRHMNHLSQVSSPSGVPAGQSDSSGDPIIAERSAADPMRLAQALPPIVPEPKALDRQEIDSLLDEYVDAYEKADIERLMATLSPRVREKGTLDYRTIRNLYAKGFAGREQIIYRLKNIQVEIKGEYATVTAQYLILARNAAQASKGTNVSGRIEWKIQREGDKAKIVAINY
jgi:DnaJ-domain-containing protein 1/ketosteroid isomerase-like protein